MSLLADILPYVRNNNVQRVVVMYYVCRWVGR